MPKRVLIVDDSRSLRQMVFFLFTSNGYSICGEAENGAQAIEKARQTRPDIIVLDYSMPVMDGIRAAKSLKQLIPRIPLHDGRVLEKEALAAGVAAIVSKENASLKPARPSPPKLVEAYVCPTPTVDGGSSFPYLRPIYELRDDPQQARVVPKRSRVIYSLGSANCPPSSQVGPEKRNTVS